MSEKKLREWAELVEDNISSEHFSLLDEIRADDPDVVKVLRDKLWPMVHVLGTGNAHWAKRVVAQELIHWIERELHIRLIGVHLSNGQLAEPEEVGWEWTGEER